MAPPGRPKAPPPPPPSSKAAGLSLVAPEPRKPVIVPERDMKPLRWKRLQLGQHVKEGATIWDDVPELPADEELVEQLLRLFSKAAPVQRAPSTDSMGPLTERGGDGGQSRELHIIKGTIQRCGREGALAKLPPPERVSRALLEFDQDALLEGAPATMQLCEMLRLVHDNACPTPAQQQKLEEARARDPEQPLGNIERYMWEVSRVPAYNERLECWLYLSTWEDDLRPVRSNIEQFETIVSCFHSPALPQLLGVVLSVGNYLNGGTKEGRADGFQLGLLKAGGIDTVRDNQSSGNLRRFVVSTWLDKCRKGAAALLVDLRPALKNVKRTLETCEGGSLRLQKQVKVSLERTCDEALNRLQTDFAEKQQMLQVVKTVTEGRSPTAARMQTAFDAAQRHLGDLQRLRDRAAERYAHLLGWLHHTAREPSETFLLLWDDFLMPSECFEVQGPSKVKSVLKPIFCDDSTEIDVYGLGRLWEVNVGGLSSRSRSTSATPRGRCASTSQAPSEGREGSRGRPTSASPWQDGRRPHSREHTEAEPSVAGSPEAAKAEAAWSGPSSTAPASRATPGGKEGLPPRPRQSSRNPSPCRRCLSSTSLGGDAPTPGPTRALSPQPSTSLSRVRTSPELGCPREETRGLADSPREPPTPKAPRESTAPFVVPSLRDCMQRLGASPSSLGSARARGSDSPVLLAREAREDEHHRRPGSRLTESGLGRGVTSCSSLADLHSERSALERRLDEDLYITPRPVTQRGSPPSEASNGQATGGSQGGGPPTRAVRGGQGGRVSVTSARSSCGGAAEATPPPSPPKPAAPSLVAPKALPAWPPAAAAPDPPPSCPASGGPAPGTLGLGGVVSKALMAWPPAAQGEAGSKAKSEGTPAAPKAAAPKAAATKTLLAWPPATGAQETPLGCQAFGIAEKVEKADGDPPRCGPPLRAVRSRAVRGG